MWRQGIHGGGVVSRGFGHCPRPKFLHGFPFTTDSPCFRITRKIPNLG